MTNELYESLVNATQEVLELMLDITGVASQRGDAALSADCEMVFGIAIGVTGDLGGEIVYCFPGDTALEMVRIMSGMDFDAVDDFVTSAIGEIANIISGKALALLSGHNVVCDILPPKVLVLDNALDSSCCKGNTDTCIITDIGAVGISINLTQ